MMFFRGAKARARESFSASLFVIVGALVFSFVVLLAVGVEHMDRNDPRAILLEKVIGYGGLFLGIIFLLIRQELASIALKVNTKATVETKDSIEKVVEQTNGGLDDRMRRLAAEYAKRFPTRDEMKQAIHEAAELAVQRAEARGRAKDAK